MIKQALLFGVLLTTTLCDEGKREDRRHKHVDPFTALDRHLSHTLAYHYLWPWSQLFKAASSLDMGDIEEPQQTSDDKTYTIKLYAKSFKPEELKVKVKERNIIVEGKHNESNEHQHFMTNHFVQRFVLPPGSKPEEVTAVFTNSVLIVSVPRHEVPPSVERVVPIEVKLSESTSEKPAETENKDENNETIKKEKKEEKKEEKKADKKEEKTTKKPSYVKPTPEQFEQVTFEAIEEESNESTQSSSAAPLDKLELQEATTHVGKIRKKELKETTKMIKANEVSKGLDGNGLDYLLVDTE